MDIVKILRMHPYEFARRAADEIEALRQIAKPENRRIETEEIERLQGLLTDREHLLDWAEAKLAEHGVTGWFDEARQRGV